MLVRLGRLPRFGKRLFFPSVFPSPKHQILFSQAAQQKRELEKTEMRVRLTHDEALCQILWHSDTWQPQIIFIYPFLFASGPSPAFRPMQEFWKNATCGQNTAKIMWLEVREGRKTCARGTRAHTNTHKHKKSLFLPPSVYKKTKARNSFLCLKKKNTS